MSDPLYFANGCTIMCRGGEGCSEPDPHGIGTMNTPTWAKAISDLMNRADGYYVAMSAGTLHHGQTKDCPTPLPNGSCPGHEIPSPDDKLRAAAREVLKAFDNGVFVRDISRDHEPGYAMRFVKPLAALATLKDLCGERTMGASDQRAAEPAGPDNERGGAPSSSQLASADRPEDRTPRRGA